MRKMTITEGLVELKLLDSRISKAIERDWIAVVKNSDTVTAKKEWGEKVKASLQSVTDLIEERKKIKSAIVKSNAQTLLKIDDKEMTVAEAIERKTSISYEKMLLEKWKNQFANAKNVEIANNNRIQEKIDTMLKEIVASDKEDIGELSYSIEESYRRKNGVEMLDPINLEAKIEELDNEIDGFMKNVDTALSLSNATTFIEID
jgi:hypothetical protein